MLWDLIYKQSVLWALFVSFAFLVACGDYEREQFRMESGKRYPLKTWPDSILVSRMDSVFKSEPLLRPDSENKPEVTISPTQRFQLPLASSSSQATSKSPSGVSETKKQATAEVFAQKFLSGLDRLRSDLDNPQLGQKYTVRSGESLSALLVRVYGAPASQMPMMMVQSFLGTVNPGLNLSTLREGDSIRLPRLP